MPTSARTPRSHRPRQTGFTLIEMAVVIFVMAIVLGSILVPLSSQVEQRQNADVRRQLDEIREALIGYALAQTIASLPCPDKTTAAGGGSANDGVADVNTDGSCAAEEGNVPWVTLGVSAVDPWGRRIRYRVSPDFADGQSTSASPNTIGIKLDSVGTLQVCSSATASLGACDPNEAITETTVGLNKPAAILISHGPNGWGAINPATNAQVLPPGCAAAVGCTDPSMGSNEIANADGNTIFVSRPPSSSSSGAGQFDDVVVWLSPHLLKQRLVAGGKLP